ncbi:AAA family ATPase [Streptomyces mobaraensis NBRC 13819 = DSM 40847]|uniref:LuxR family transcriptional regulator n=1 Tax=Streptomyces mobaraensis (strain ATCC 29032 / DSM 40847 / JCM 4168 / NBRC 13819 / NCIMB 11159 / IPCR 16-22) TaxID=1223523 RepID=M3C8R6_STRM1|nr:LuxR family transcriptional regulator [Streptomyces mobaraensis]EMF00387.1 LuxR family transcriptional regulator [Streptomyces mobaraensis NBRC 13819 = DSM 40847]QTT77358.1 AAA family ATPase [Streptomyces mobaraensis NBRC 13819 = DSM 40847]
MASVGATGRGSELARLAGLFDEARAGRPVTVLVRGEPGAGKSALLEAAAGLAAAAGFHVAVGDARGLPDRPFAAAGCLLDRLPGPGDQDRAQAPAPGADPLGELVERARRQAARAPVALCLDDASRLDTGSLRWLLALSRSMPPARLAIVLAARDLATAPGAEFAVAAEVLDLTGLPADAVTPFAETRCGVSLDAAAARACHELTGGNPALLLALLAGRSGSAPAPDDLRPAPGAAALPGAERWLGGLTRPALELARAVAVLGADAEITQAARLAGLDVGETLPAVDELVGRCLLANRTPLTFRHPLLATMVTERIPAGTRAALHLRAAELLRDGGFGATRVARHLVAAGPLGLSWTVEPLMTAARRLAGEGRTEEAAQHLRGLLRERLRPRVRAAVRCELARLDGFVNPDRAIRLLDAARREAEDPAVATDYALDLAALLAGCGRPVDAVAVLDDTADRIGPAAPGQLRRLRLHRALVRVAGPARLFPERERPDGAPADEAGTAGAVDPPDAPESPHSPHSPDVPDSPDTAGRPAALRAVHAVRAGEDRAGAVRYAREALAAGGDGGTATVLWYGCRTLIHADELTEAATWCGRYRPVRGARPGRWTDVAVDLLRATVRRVRGDLPGVIEMLAPLTEPLCTEPGASHVLARLAVAALIEAGAMAGDTDTARTLLTRWGLDGEQRPRQDTVGVLAARAVLRSRTGEVPGAVEDWYTAGRMLTELGVRNPAVLPWRSRAAHLLAAEGETAEAARLARAELEDAHRWGTPRAVGTALHAVAMTETGPRRIELLDSAVALLGRSPARLGVAAARLDLGRALGAAGRAEEACDAFTAASAGAESCGARPLARRIAAARREMCPTEERETLPATLTGLTPQELRILSLARDGHTNREIAGRLFVTLRTVEFHLSGAYRKLGISGRRQLAEVMPAESRTPA